MNCNSSGTLQKHFQDETRNNCLKPIFLISGWKNFTLVYSSTTLSSTLILYCVTFDQTPVEWTAALISIAVIDKTTHKRMSHKRMSLAKDCQMPRDERCSKHAECCSELAPASSGQGTTLCADSQILTFWLKNQPGTRKHTLEDRTGTALLLEQNQSLLPALSYIYTVFPLLVLQILNAACHPRLITASSMQGEIWFNEPLIES